VNHVVINTKQKPHTAHTRTTNKDQQQQRTVVSNQQCCKKCMPCHIMISPFILDLRKGAYTKVLVGRNQETRNKDTTEGGGMQCILLGAAPTKQERYVCYVLSNFDRAGGERKAQVGEA
jgi:hypothetical protein